MDDKKYPDLICYDIYNGTFYELLQNPPLKLSDEDVRKYYTVIAVAWMPDNKAVIRFKRKANQ